MLEGGSIHLSHVSLILLDRDNGVASREEQGHCAAREDNMSKPRNTQLRLFYWGYSRVQLGEQEPALGSIKITGPSGTSSGQ